MTLQVLHDRPPGDARGSLLAPLLGRRVAVIGFGNQGRAHALNMRDSGLDVVVGARPGPGAKAAEAEGFQVLPLADAARDASLVVVAVPDPVQASVCRAQFMPVMQADSVLGFIHGFAVRFGGLTASPELGVVLVAPKGPGVTLRERFLEGRGIPCLFAVHQETPSRAAEAVGLAWASALGCGRAGIVRTTFADETETDLFGEQAVLCGGAMALAQAGFETLVEAGYPPELAYLECVHELKQVVDLLFLKGFDGMRRSISHTAEFGAFWAGARLVDESMRERLRQLLQEIRSGAFAKALEEDLVSGSPWLEAQRRAARKHGIEEAGRTVRSWMPWMADAGGAPAASVQDGRSDSPTVATPQPRRAAPGPSGQPGSTAP